VVIQVNDVEQNRLFGTVCDEKEELVARFWADVEDGGALITATWLAP
jgi:hypothetical protein